MFKALVDSIIPRTPRLAKEYDSIMYYGALDFQTDDFITLSLNNYYIPLAIPTAQILDIAAQQVLSLEGREQVLNSSKYPGEGAFAALSNSNRFRVLTLLEELGFYLIDLPMAFEDYPELIMTITSALNRFTMMGYYSEWYGYGATRMNTPDQRILEFSPLSWIQVGYPGPSFSYRAYVTDYYKRREEIEQ